MIKRKVVDYLLKIGGKDSPNEIEKNLLAAYILYRNTTKSLQSIENENISKLYVQSRYFRSCINGKRFIFVTIDDAVIWTSEWLKSFPTQYDIIVGIPRSGMLIANVIALRLGKPLTTPDLFAQRQFWLSAKAKKHPDYTKSMKVLLVDDSINSGRTMQRNIKLMRTAGIPFDVTRAALIVSTEKKPKVDLYYKYIKHPRVFEWNMLHRKIASYTEKGKLAVDMDGVLCENCPPNIDIVESEYKKWIRTAKPYLIPSFEIDAIVTCRLEKYREATEKWLKDNNVMYKELILWDIQSKKQRRGRWAKHKIDALLRIKPHLFWESNLKQANQIWEATRIPVLCTDNWIMHS